MNSACPECGSKEYNENNVCIRCGYFTDQIPPGRVLMNRYKIIKPIKAGGMGAIYLAQDTHDDKKYALKQMFIYEEDEKLKEYTIKRFTSEAELLVELDYPSIPKVIDYFCESGYKYYMVMDYIEGVDLYTYATGEGKGLPEDTVVKWGIEICDVLDYLHSRPQPIIHRDVNPTNLILRKKDGYLMLVDFGFARSVDPSIQVIKTSVGTSTFAAPEQYMGYPEPRSDLYSLGATMHFLLTLQQSALSFFPPVREIRPDVSLKTERIIAKVLSYNPAERFASAHQMADALTEMVETLIFRSEEKKEKKLFGGEKFIPLTGKDDFYEEEGFAEESEFPVISEHSDLDIPLDKDEISMLLGEVEKSPGRLKGNDAKNSSAVKKNLPEKSVKPQKKTEEKKQKKSFDMFRWFKK